MNPVEVYETRQPFDRRRFELYDDWIRVVGSRAAGDFDVTFTLAQLDSRFERLWLHGLFFHVGFWLTLIAAVLLMAFVTVAEMQNQAVSLVKPYGLIGSVGATGLALALWNRRKIEYVRFRTNAGVPVLAIPHDGRESGKFNRFVGLLIERIHNARGEAIPPDVVPGDS